MKHLSMPCIFRGRLIIGLVFLGIAGLFIWPGHLLGSDSDPPIDFTALSLEELKNVEITDVEITSVSKKREKISEAPAAVFVITQDDIRRSGVTTIPDALRLAPGVQVARTDTRGWAVSVRGFNDYYSNKLLVLIDGRSVYSPIFSGVFWDTQDTLLSDIERIEVIRGPGSVLWGANAVNGVINIITKHAKDTRGGLVTAGIGSEECGFGSVRYGDTLKENTYYRIYAKYFSRGQLESTCEEDDDNDDGDPMEVMSEDMRIDSWYAFRGGFRVDYEPWENDSVMIQGEGYFNRDDIESDTAGPFSEDEQKNSKIRGGHILGRWRHTFSETSELGFHAYYDRVKRNSADARYAVNTFDFDFHHRFTTGECHEVTWGLGYRFISDEIDNFYYHSYLIYFKPETKDQFLYSAFVQDEIRLFDDRLRLTIGSKVEHNDFTGTEIQPGVRMLWAPSERHSLWGAVSRAVRVPARLDHDGTTGIHIPDSPFDKHRKPRGTEDPGEIIIIDTRTGSEDFDSEEVIAYELGYKVQPSDQLWIDAAAFYNQYDNLKTYEECWDCDDTSVIGDDDFGDSDFPFHINRFYSDNNMKGYSYGFELAADWRVTNWWRIRGEYSYLNIDMRLNKESTDTDTETELEGEDPRNQFSLRSSLDIGRSLELDLWLRYVDNLPSEDIESYTAFDAQLIWKPYKNFEFSIVGQNLIDHYHHEFSSVEVERGGYCKINWRF